MVRLWQGQSGCDQVSLQDGQSGCDQVSLQDAVVSQAVTWSPCKMQWSVRLWPGPHTTCSGQSGCDQVSLQDAVVSQAVTRSPYNIQWLVRLWPGIPTRWSIRLWPDHSVTCSSQSGCDRVSLQHAAVSQAVTRSPYKMHGAVRLSVPWSSQPQGKSSQYW